MNTSHFEDGFLTEETPPDAPWLQELPEGQWPAVEELRTLVALLGREAVLKSSELTGYLDLEEEAVQRIVRKYTGDVPGIESISGEGSCRRALMYDASHAGTFSNGEASRLSFADEKEARKRRYERRKKV